MHFAMWHRAYCYHTADAMSALWPILSGRSGRCGPHSLMAGDVAPRQSRTINIDVDVGRLPLPC